jgi:hypothetical protein
LKRITMLLALLLLVVAGCASQTASSAEASETAAEEATPEPTPTEEPASEPPDSSDGGCSGDGPALTDGLPDEVGGRSRTDIPGLEAMLAPMLSQSGAEVSAADFAFASYGEGANAVQVQAFRVPDMGDVELEALARAMAGANATGELETATVGGKQVLQMTGAGTTGAVYLYFGRGGVFTVISQDAGLAEQLLAELP